MAFQNEVRILTLIDNHIPRRRSRTGGSGSGSLLFSALTRSTAGLVELDAQ